MDTFSPRTSSSCSTYTSGFLNQLQSEWNEFILEISHSTPRDRTNNCDTKKSFNKCSAKAAFVESLNKFNLTSEGNIFIPVPLKTLKKFFSPSKHNVDIFKNDFFKEIKENLSLTKLSCKKLQQLLSIDESNEISDFPSPSLPTHFRSSAPPNLFPVKKSKPVKTAVFKTFDRNTNEIDGNSLRKTDPAAAESCKVHKHPRNLLSANLASKCVETCNVRVLEKNTSLNDKNFSLREKIKSIDSKKKSVDDKHEIRVENGFHNRQNNYTGSDSSSLFYTFKRTKKLSKPTIVCTYFNQKELSEIYQTVKKLGFFDVENHVSSRTTHLVCGGSNKTINLCKAIARGCWILDKEWITGSNEANRWLLEERFEKKTISPAVRENRMKRQKSGSTYRCEVFLDCGSIYVSTECTQPSARELEELILLGSGHLEESPERASYIVGHSPKSQYVKEIWILNCLLRGRIIDTYKYVRNKSKS